MPDQEKSTLTPQEKSAQSTIRTAIGILKNVRAFLELAHFNLPDPPDAEDMGEGRIPESLTFSLRGALECALSDHLRPLLKVLRKAAKETPQSLRADFARRHRKAGKGKGEVN